MNKAGFILSGIFSIIGVVTFIVTRIVQMIMPVLGRVAFQAAMKGSYTPSDYYINFKGLQFGSGILIIISLILCFIFYKKEVN
ncbi:MAG: hypothetical protein ACOCV3_07315 [Halanaerobiales bacterium]